MILGDEKMEMRELVCPVCKSGDDLWDVDQLDYGVWALKCGNCDWEGTSEDLIQKEGY